MSAIWSGAISFGLIHIPVQLYSATRENTLKFQYLRKQDLCPIGYIKVCKSTGEEVAWDEVVRGYEYEKGDFVMLSDEDFHHAAVKRSEVIAIESFVEEKEIDQMYYTKPYYIGPDQKSDRVYNYLLEALKKTKKVGLGKFVFQKKEHLVALKAENGILVLNMMRLSNEIKHTPQESLPKKTPVSKRELAMAIELIDKLTDHFDPEKYVDTYSEKLEKMIEAKKKGKKFHVKVAKQPKATKATDLLTTLRASLRSAHQKTTTKH